MPATGENSTISTKTGHPPPSSASPLLPYRNVHIPLLLLFENWHSPLKYGAGGGSNYEYSKNVLIFLKLGSFERMDTNIWMQTDVLLQQCHNSSVNILLSTFTMLFCCSGLRGDGKISHRWWSASCIDRGSRHSNHSPHCRPIQTRSLLHFSLYPIVSCCITLSISDDTYKFRSMCPCVPRIYLERQYFM